MTDVVSLDSFSLLPQGQTLSLQVAPGESVAVVGPAASGKSRFLRCLAGSERAAQGAVHVLGSPAVAGREGFQRRSSPQSIVRQAASLRKSSLGAEALTACGLWDIKNRLVAELSPSQLAACELLLCLGVEARLMIIDGQLDRLDPWTLSGVLAMLRKRLMAGEALVAATNRPELLQQFDRVILLSGQRAAFAGSVQELLKHGPADEVEIESVLQPGTRALLDPFTIGVRQQQEKLVFQTEEGQELAAKLLLEGYGDVKFVVVRQPTAEQALMRLTRSQAHKLNR